MQLENTFSVPVPVEDAWRVLLDVAQIAPCMPGATVESVDGDNIVGRVKVKLGPMVITYHGTLTFLERDESAHRAVLSASAREARGGGTASATFTAVMRDLGGETEVSVQTDLNVTGKPAQFGRGVLADVSENIIQQFATSLARQIETGDVGLNPVASGPRDAAVGLQTEGRGVPAETSAIPPKPTEVPLRVGPRPSAEAIDLLGTAGAPLVKRGGPVLVSLALGCLIGWLIGRRQCL
jgi:carbon monoxide dehydrogenase subunit G